MRIKLGTRDVTKIASGATLAVVCLTGIYFWNRPQNPPSPGASGDGLARTSETKAIPGKTESSPRQVPHVPFNGRPVSSQYNDLVLSDIATAAAADPELQTALRRWCEAARTGASLSKDDTDRLNAAADASTLDASVLLAIAKCIKQSASKEPLLIGTLAVSASTKLHEDLPGHPVGTAGYRQTLKQLNQAKGMLWHGINQSNPQFVPQLLVVCEDLSNCEPGSDPVLQSAKIYGYTGAAGALYLMDRNEEALAKLDTLLTSTSLTTDQAISVAWVRGLSLFGLKRYADAIPHLKIAASQNSFEHQAYAILNLPTEPDRVFSHTRDALLTLMNAELKAKEFDAYEYTLKTYTRSFELTTDQALSLRMSRAQSESRP